MSINSTRWWENGHHRFLSLGKVLTVLLVVVLAVFIVVVNDSDDSDATGEKSGICGEHLTWTINDSGDLTIDGYGSLYYEWGDVRWGGNDVRTVSFPDGLTSIGDYSFQDCTSLESVTIPDNVEGIGIYAFSGCTSLTTVTIPVNTYVSNRAFAGCSSMEAIIVDDSNPDFTSLDGVLFDKGMNTLIQYPAGKNDSHYSIPDSVTTIDQLAFSGCLHLTSVTIPESVQVIQWGAFSDCISLESVIIPEGVNTIPLSTFNGCTSLESVVIPSTVTSIGYTAFYNCTSLSTIDLPDGLLSIGSMAFQGCTSLTSIRIPDTVTTLESQIFYHCDSLEYIYIGNSVTTDIVGRSLLFDCPSLNTIEVGDSNSLYSSSDGVLFSKDMRALLIYPEGKMDRSYVIPNTVETLGYCSFENNDHLISVVMPGSVRTIGMCAFADCSYLCTVTLGNNLESIDTYFAFQNCKRLFEVINKPQLETTWFNVNHTLGPEASPTVEITESGFIYGYYNERCYLLGYVGNNTEIALPETIEDNGYNISENAFFNCESITSINIPASVDVIGYNSGFIGCSSLTSIVVSDDSENYRSINGVLFSKDSTTLLVYPAGKTNESYDIPETVTGIATFSFNGCRYLQTIYLPDSMGLLYSSMPFMGCTSLLSIVVGNSNESMESHNGVLYSKDLTTLLLYPAGKTNDTFTVPNTVNTINSYSFYDCSNLKEITIPASVTAINDTAFYNCTSLKIIFVPDGNPLDIKCGYPDNGQIGYYAAAVLVIDDDYQYTVRYVDSEGNEIADESISQSKYGSVIEPPTIDIIGYSPIQPAYPITISYNPSHNIVTYVYRINEYNVIYKVDGVIEYTDRYDYCSEVTVRSVFTKTGYTVTDWATEDVVVTDGRFILGASNVTFNATTTVNQYGYTVRYVDALGNSIHDPFVGSADYHTSVLPEIIAIEGYAAPSQTTSYLITDNTDNNVITLRYFSKNHSEGDPGDTVWTDLDAGYYANVKIKDPSTLAEYPLVDYSSLFVTCVMPSLEIDYSSISVDSIDADLQSIYGIVRDNDNFTVKDVLYSKMKGNITVSFTVKKNYTFGESGYYVFSGATDSFNGLNFNKGDKVTVSMYVDLIIGYSGDNKASRYESDRYPYYYTETNSVTREKGTIEYKDIVVNGEKASFSIACSADLNTTSRSTYSYDVIHNSGPSGTYTTDYSSDGSVTIRIFVGSTSSECSYRTNNAHSEGSSTARTEPSNNFDSLGRYKSMTYADSLAIIETQNIIANGDSESTVIITKEEQGYGLVITDNESAVAKEAIDVLVNKAKNDSEIMLTVSSETITINLDNTAMKNLITDNFTVSMKDLDSETFGLDKGSVVVEISLGDNHVNFDGGKITVTLPYSGGMEKPMAYCIVDGELTEPLECTVNDDGTISFVTTHLSTFAIVDSVDDEDEEFPIWIVLVIIAVVAVVSVGTFFIIKKKA